jgi:hypothetical protein
MRIDPDENQDANAIVLSLYNPEPLPSPYVLAFPNQEIAVGFTKCLLTYYTGQDAAAYSTVVSHSDAAPDRFRVGVRRGLRQPDDTRELSAVSSLVAI